MHEPSSDEKTHFGFEEVPIQEKVKRVAEVFHSVADNYDLMNDLMSLGIHRLWKKQALRLAGVKKGHKVLDLAGGTGDLTKGLIKQVGPSGQVILADINASMLTCGRSRLYDEGFIQPLSFVQADGESLPFPTHYFDRATIAFGLRNITRKERALASLYQVLKPGGQLIILEFSQPLFEPLKKIYDLYSFKILPKLGEWVANDADSYRYLAESIRMHPNQADLKSMVLAAGFDECEVRNLTGGIVAIHICRKF